MKRFLIFTSLTFFVFFVFTSCRKRIEAGTDITASGIVFDKVKNRPIPNAKLYLFGSNRTVYSPAYINGPLDSTVSDNNGKFFIQYTAEGQSIDYGLTLAELLYGGYIYNENTNYVVDYTEPIFKFNHSTHIKNAVVKGRELNYTKVHLTVLSNPWDSFYLRTYALLHFPVLIKGHSFDTTVILRHLPNEKNEINYYTESRRDTVGLAALNSDPNVHLYSIRRMVSDTINATMADTIYVSKTITNSLSMPRQ